MSTERTLEDVLHGQVEMAKARGFTIPTRTDPKDYALFRELLGDDAFEAALAAEHEQAERATTLDRLRAALPTDEADERLVDALVAKSTTSLKTRPLTQREQVTTKGRSK